MNRREYIKKSLYAGALLYTGKDLPLFTPAAVEKSKVVIAKDNSVKVKLFQYNNDVISSMLDKAVNRLYGTKDVIDAWRMVAGRSDVVGLKVNCLSGKRMSTSVELVNEVIARLVKSGVKKRNIIIWDRMDTDLKKGGYELNKKGSGVKCFGNDSAGFEKELVIYGEIGSLLSRTLTQYCSVVINLPVLKDHGIVGVTNSLKNYFGAIHNPNKYHEKLGDPYIADLWLVPDIRNKTKLIICDALTAQYEGGPPFKPQWIWDYNGIIIGNDPVAIDYTGWKIIEDKRRERGLKSLKEAGREPNYINTAADNEHKIGTNNPGMIEVINV